MGDDSEPHPDQDETYQLGDIEDLYDTCSCEAATDAWKDRTSGDEYVAEYTRWCVPAPPVTPGRPQGTSDEEDDRVQVD